jgi:Cu+-exporting ATPase
MMAGTGKAAELGLLFKGADAVEAASKVQVVIFDKTGTLTKGQPSVTDVVQASGRRAGLSPAPTPDDLLRLAAAAEKSSEHPLGEAILREASERGIEVPGTDSFDSLPGLGVEATVEGLAVLLGNRPLMAERGIEFAGLAADAERLEIEGKTVMLVAVDGAAAGLIAVADTIKETSARAVAELERMGIEVAMITGDNSRTANAIAAQLGIDRVLAEVRPAGKAEAVKALQAEGKVVAMVGDGVNDAPALAQADVGIAIGSGTDVAKETGDVILIRDDILDVLAAIQVSKQTMRLVRQNLWWAFGYNLAAIPIGAGLLYPLTNQVVSPELAALLMAMSSFSVTMNTLRMRGFTPPIKRGPPPAPASPIPVQHPAEATG